MVRIGRVTAGLGLGAGALVLSVTPAGATATTTGIVHTGNFAGYTASTPAGTTSVTTRMRVPTLSNCPATGSVTILPNLNWGDTSGDSAFGIAVESCNNGTVTSAIVEAGVQTGTTPTITTLPASAGDAVSVSISYSASTGRITVHVTDTTKATKTSASKIWASAPQALAVGTSVSGSAGAPPYSPLPSFQTLSFSGVEAHGAAGTAPTALAAMAPARFEIYDGTTLQVATTAINSTTGTSFSTHFHHS